MTYDAPTGTVIYRSKMHAGLKGNFQLMPGAQWLELLCRYILSLLEVDRLAPISFSGLARVNNPHRDHS